MRYIGADGRTEASILAFLAEHDATASLEQGLTHLVERRADARPDAHTRDYYSSFHNIKI
jgi:hypothetical protein